MSIIKCFSDNPEDGASTFDKIKFYEANDSAGTGATLIQTVDVDTSTRDLNNPGYTVYLYGNGSTSKYYASKWYSTDLGYLTDYSTWVKGGEDRIDTLFKNELDDTAEAVFTATDRAYFKKAALEALHPEIFKIVIDTSITVENNSTTQTYEYALPHGMNQVLRVGIGNVNKTALEDRTYKTIKNIYWSIEKDKIVFSNIGQLTDGYSLRIVGTRKYNHIGEVPIQFDWLILLHMKMSAYLQLADDYPRFKQWAQMQEGSKVSFENLRVHAREYERKFNTEKAKIKNTALESDL